MKRSPLTRKTPLRSGPNTERSEHPQAKEGRGRKPVAPKTCAYCHKPFLPFQSMQKVCATLRCAKGYAAAQLRAKEKAERESFKARREAIRTIPHLIAAADREFMAYIRTRDRLAGHPCISSGKPLDWSGNQVDAGHYRSRGAASHLRYNEDNCHAQSKYENRHRAGNAVGFRIGLLDRIGLARVEALEADNKPHKWTREELLWVIAHYRAKRKELERTRGC